MVAVMSVFPKKVNWPNVSGNLSTFFKASRGLASHARSKEEGDISSVFISLSGASPAQLPDRFSDIKRRLIHGNESKLLASWKRLLRQLNTENKIVAQHGPNIVPQINFKDLKTPSDQFINEVKKRGVAVVRGVVAEKMARGYKFNVEKYVAANPGTKGFPSHDPQVFELYWSPSQIAARSHPNVIETQRLLMNLWHSKGKDALISTTQPLVYADRLRIRQPGDTGFALGPHVDGGSVERWEPDGYGKGKVYDTIWQGKWEEFDPWESSCRVHAISDLYDGAGACSVFRMFQGWLSMSHTGPNEGTLMVNPLLQLSTAYFLLRPLFTPIKTYPTSDDGQYTPEFLDPENWKLQGELEMTSDLQGANPGHAQELNQALHPHLDLKRTMVHVPTIKPGDFVIWHCDTIHAVDKIHKGTSDSSVMYIPVCPVTEANAAYLSWQLNAFIDGFPGPDFPGGEGQSEYWGYPTTRYLKKNLQKEALRGMGLERLSVLDEDENMPGAKQVMEKANSILVFPPVNVKLLARREWERKMREREIEKERKMREREKARGKKRGRNNKGGTRRDEQQGRKREGGKGTEKQRGRKREGDREREKERESL